MRMQQNSVPESIWKVEKSVKGEVCEEKVERVDPNAPPHTPLLPILLPDLHNLIRKKPKPRMTLIGNLFHRVHIPGLFKYFLNLA